jgi:DNA-binding NarL/FixJ family response regulator
MSNGASPHPNGRIRILICDDSEGMRAMLRSVVELRDNLDVVGEAADGNEAIVEAKRLQPNVILLDLAMPNKSGLDALAEIKEAAPRAQVVVLSGFAAASVEHEVLAHGAARYLEKGAIPEQILVAIELAAAALIVSPG